MKRLLLIVVIALSGCANHTNLHRSTQDSTDIPIKEHIIMGVLWQQNAAEYRALCHQAFNLARLQLNRIMKSIDTTRPLAIITDIDETILDNSPYAVELINEDQNYTRNSWQAWGEKESAPLVPGAAAFLADVQSMGIEVFYVSNRYQAQITETINNLKNHNLPNADESHVLLKQNSSGKELRRKHVSESHEILLLLGDNLSDFHEVFDGQNSAHRNQQVENMNTLFGQQFIVFPNPNYGDWESQGIYEGKRLNEHEKRAMRKQKLKP